MEDRELERIGAALERIAGVMERLGFWVKVGVITGRAYVALTLLFGTFLAIFGPISGMGRPSAAETLYAIASEAMPRTGRQSRNRWLPSQCGILSLRLH